MEFASESASRLRGRILCFMLAKMAVDLQTIIVMGVCGSGKTRVGELLAKRLGGVFEDADDFHPPANKAKMSSGVPLCDEDRWPWYEILRRRIEDHRASGKIYVLACSALKPSYRAKLRGTDAPGQIAFALMDGSEAVIAERLAARKGHFMPPSLLTSQLATLEVTPDVLRVSIEQTPEAIVDAVMTCLA
jgi:gluconokinase